MIVAIDWSFIKQLTTYDGKKIRVEDVDTLIKRIHKSCKESSQTVKSNTCLNLPDFEVAGDESTMAVKSNDGFKSPACIIEQECPLSLIYKLASNEINVGVYILDKPINLCYTIIISR
jgi:hypothetical protein